MAAQAVALLSGGLDSLVSCAIAVEQHTVVAAITCDYGQRAAKQEIAASAALCRLWSVPHQVIALPWLASWTQTALVDRTAAVPRFSAGASALLDDPTTTAASASAVWVPNRNGVFVNIAAALAESLGAEWIITGFNAEEAQTFPDNSVTFVERMNACLQYSTLRHPQLVSFTQTMTKAQILAHALEHDLPLAHCWPCYEGGAKWCGTCESCARLRRAMRAIPAAARSTLEKHFA